jgi:hypothetical protein
MEKAGLFVMVLLPTFGLLQGWLDVGAMII